MPTRSPLRALAAALSLSALCLPAQARMLCTVVADVADGRIVFQDGTQDACAARYTPASTFKLAIALMGYDAGILQDAHAPVWDYQPSYPDWGGDDWRKPVDPTHWIKYSVFWYSQQIGEKLGLARLQQYTTAFGYGNQDVSGHPGKNNGTRGAWHVSSLRISPLEQLDFLRRLARRQLPVKPQAYDMAEILFDAGVDADGWKIHGKTGTGSPGSFGDYDREHAYGWYVGWARKDGRELVFARLIQDEKAARPNAGMRAREQLLAGLPGWLGAAGQR